VRRSQIFKKLLKPYFGSLRSFKVIDVNTTKKFVTSSRYDMQHLTANLQPISR